MIKRIDLHFTTIFISIQPWCCVPVTVPSFTNALSDVSHSGNMLPGTPMTPWFILLSFQKVSEQLLLATVHLCSVARHGTLACADIRFYPNYRVHPFNSTGHNCSRRIESSRDVTYLLVWIKLQNNRKSGILIKQHYISF